MVNLCYLYLVFKLSFIFESIMAESGKKVMLSANYFVFHHILISWAAWFAANYYPGGNITFVMAVNSLVHFIMSINFLVALIFPKLKQYTKMLKNFFELVMVRNLIIKPNDKNFKVFFQMLQFIISIAHQFQLLFWNPCNIPNSIIYGPGVIGLSIFAYHLIFIRSLKKLSL
jgi:GNS1/SUR4 family